MTRLAAALVAVTAAVIFWRIAADAGVKRRLPIGPLPALLLALVAASGVAASMAGAPISALAALGCVAVCGWVDARTGSIFDPLTGTMLAVAFALGVVQGTAVDALSGAVAVTAVLVMIYVASHGRGLGLGDVKLGAGIGMALGTAAGLTAMGIAFVLGAGYGVVLIATKRAKRSTSIRFGPFIAAGTFVTILVPVSMYR